MKYYATNLENNILVVLLEVRKFHGPFDQNLSTTNTWTSKKTEKIYVSFFLFSCVSKITSYKT